VVQILSKLHENEYSAKCTNVNHHQTSCMLLSIIPLLHSVDTSSAYLNLFYAHCTLQITVRSVACNKLEVSGRKWYWRNKKCNQTMPQWDLECLIFGFEFKIDSFRNQIIFVSQWTHV
jgi:hypothetical protein